MNLTNVDLNLFVVLQAVLEERSATRAAARLHVTQPAVSNALARLRDLLGDPLVVRAGRGLALTPLAIELAPRLEAALGALAGAVERAAPFDPATTTRELTMACGDVYGVTLIPRLVADLAERAPRVSLRVLTVDRMLSTDGLEGGEIDVYVGIPGAPPRGCSAEDLFEDEAVCLVRRDHPRVRGRLTLAMFVELPHVQVAMVPGRGREVDEALARRGLTRRIALSVPHQTVAPAVVAQTDCIATLSRRIAEHYAASLPVRLVEPPLPLPSARVRTFWHRRVADDPAVLFLRARLQAAAASPRRLARPKPARRTPPRP